MARSNVSIPSFKYGLDTRRDVLVSQMGVLVACTNAHINDGGEVEKRTSIKNIFAGTAYDFTGTFGVLAFKRDNEYSGLYSICTFAGYWEPLVNPGPNYPTFNTVVVGTNWEVGVTCFRCRHPKGSLGGADDLTMSELKWAINFGGYPLCCVGFSDGKYFIYYGGSNTPSEPIDASVMGIVIPTLTSGQHMSTQLARWITGSNGPGLKGWLACVKIDTVTVANGGSGYNVGDILYLVGGVPGPQSAPCVTVNTTGIIGEVTSVILTYGGTPYHPYYKIAPFNPVSTYYLGPGTGCTVYLSLVSYTDILAPIGVSASFALPVWSDTSQSISIQHVRDNLSGYGGNPCTASFTVNTVGAVGEVWTITADGTVIGSYTVVAGDGPGTVAAGIAGSINATVSAKNCTAIYSANFVTVMGAPGDTTLNGKMLNVSTTGSGSSTSFAGPIARVYPGYAQGSVETTWFDSGFAYSNAVTATAYGLGTGTINSYTWRLIAGNPIGVTAQGEATTSFFGRVGPGESWGDWMSGYFVCDVSVTIGGATSILTSNVVYVVLWNSTWVRPF